MKKLPYRTLSAEIAHLEATDPAVARAAAAYDATVRELLKPPTCTATVRPLKERFARACRKPATHLLPDGKYRCKHHNRGRGQLLTALAKEKT